MLSVLSGPGGVGKTTIALILAYALCKAGKNPLLIDTDPSLGLTLSLLGFKRARILDENGRTLADAIEVSRRKKADFNFSDYVEVDVEFYDVKIDIVPSSPRLSEVLGRYWHGVGESAEEPLKRFLSTVRDSPHDVVIVDSIPFYEVRYSKMACKSSDYRLLVTTPRPIDVWRTNYMVETLLNDGIVDLDELRGSFKILINKVPKGTSSLKDVVIERDWKRLKLGIVERYKIGVLETVIPELEAFAIEVERRRGLPAL